MPKNNIFEEEKNISGKKLLKGINVFRREVSVDQNLIDLFFSTSDGLYTEKTKELDFEDHKKVDEINYIINNMLPEIEKQIIYLLFFLKKNQEVVGRILNICQEMVYYYKKRALARIRIHYFFRRIDIDQMEKFLDQHVTKKQKIAMLEYFKEHDLRKIASKISKMENRNKPIHYEAIGSRIKLGYRKIKNLKQSEDNNLKIEAERYCQVFDSLKQYNSLHHTQSKKTINREIFA